MPSKDRKADEVEEQVPAGVDAEQTAEPQIPGTAGVVDPNVMAEAMAATLTNDSGETEPLRKARRGHQLLKYVGYAETISHGDIRFRPGEVVEVPKDVAEELLTLPHEEFEVVTVEAEGDDG